MLKLELLAADSLAELTEKISAAMPLVISRIPAGTAAELVRARESDDVLHRSGTIIASEDDSRVAKGLRSMRQMLVERLYGALELTVSELDVTAPAEILAAVTPIGTAFGMMTSRDDSEAGRGLIFLEAGHPGSTDVLLDCVDYLMQRPEITDLLAVDANVTGEQEIAAIHGAAYLGLAVTVSAALFRGLPESRTIPAIIGAGLGAAAHALSHAPMPGAYDNALLEKRRAEYLYASYSINVTVREHLFTLSEGDVPADAGAAAFSGNGLVVPVRGGAMVRTGATDRAVKVVVDVLADAPQDVTLDEWEEVVEVSWTAVEGSANILGQERFWPRSSFTTPPWPGDYRLRVHARGRDGDDTEAYRLAIWAAPHAPDIVHKATDRLGHRLRGESEPPILIAPYADHRWVESSGVEMAATFTLITGSTTAEVLRAFGADPSAPVSINVLANSGRYEQWVAVLALDSMVLAIEDNGSQGSLEPVLRALSRNGKAASVFWNINGHDRLGFAENGRVIASFDPVSDEVPADPELADILDGLDFTDFRHMNAKGMTAIARYMGRTITESDLSEAFDPGIGYRTSDIDTH
ncbi:DUF6461 domain-containing protein [Nocardia sp. NPDC051030]|uniref:DUF6461 domain-containing protein n=1 Tax=Nocardia sp. NPDC051030 TaxID=3155162 RepID=UPI0034136C09